MKDLVYLKDVVTLTLDADRCIGCGLCETVCPHAVFGMNDRHAVILRRDFCMECGACAKNCPAAVIAVQTGVGCAAAVINTALGRKDDSCCCILEPQPDETFDAAIKSGSGKRSCC